MHADAERHDEYYDNKMTYSSRGGKWPYDLEAIVADSGKSFPTAKPFRASEVC